MFFVNFADLATHLAGDPVPESVHEVLLPMAELTEEQREKRRASSRAYAARNREKRAAATAAYRAANPEKARASVAAYRARNPEKYRARNAENNAARREKLYGLRRTIAASQGFTCPCGSALGPEDGWALDHDHACCRTNKAIDACGNCYRGVMHKNCNCAIGFAGDDPDKLRRLAQYLSG